MALTAVKGLMDYCCGVLAFKYICTRRLCQDPIENFFGVIRSRNGSNTNPSCLAFLRTFKIIITS